MSTADKKARENISVLISEMGELILNDDQKELYGWLEKDVKKIEGTVVHVPKKTTQNFIRILTYDENTKIYMRNNFTGKLERTDVDPQRPWCKEDTAILKTYIEKYYGLACSTKFNDAFTIMTSDCYGYHPIVNILSEEKWDGKPHCQRFFIDYFGAEDTAYNKEVSRLIFCGAINRILNPGCKWDYLPVLIGKQGSGKSTITRWLALQDEFYTSVKTIKGKRGEESIQSVWICEVEELAALKQVGAEEAKAFISGSVDYYRDTYGKETTRHPRQCVFIGTSNSASVINDVTGARRFLPLELHSEGADIFIHEAEIRKEIKQCYAEMVCAYMRETEMNYPTVAPAVAKEVESRQSNATVDDWRIGVIEEYLKGKSAVCICQIKREALARIGGGTVPTAAESREIADVLISKLGCTRGGVKRFEEYGKQKSFIVPASLATSMTGTATTTIESKHSMAKSA